MVVESMTLNEDFSLNVELAEYLDGTYDDSLVLPPLDQRPFDFTPTDVPELAPPAGITSDEIASFRPDGTLDIFVIVSWLVAHADAVQLRWRFPPGEDAPSQTDPRDISASGGGPSGQQQADQHVLSDLCQANGILYALDGYTIRLINLNTEDPVVDNNDDPVTITLETGNFSGLATDWVTLFTIKKIAVGALRSNPWRKVVAEDWMAGCLLYTSPSPRD